MRKELATRMTLEEFWEKTKTTQSKTNEDHGDNRREEPAAQTNAPKPEDIAEMVRRELSTEKTKSQKAENVGVRSPRTYKDVGSELPGTPSPQGTGTW